MWWWIAIGDILTLLRSWSSSVIGLGDYLPKLLHDAELSRIQQNANADRQSLLLQVQIDMLRRLVAKPGSGCDPQLAESLQEIQAGVSSVAADVRRLVMLYSQVDWLSVTFLRERYLMEIQEMVVSVQLPTAKDRGVATFGKRRVTIEYPTLPTFVKKEIVVAGGVVQITAADPDNGVVATVGTVNGDGPRDLTDDDLACPTSTDADPKVGVLREVEIDGSGNESPQFSVELIVRDTVSPVGVDELGVLAVRERFVTVPDPVAPPVDPPVELPVELPVEPVA